MKTIFAPITAKNGGSVAIIRISGPEALNSLKIFGIKLNLQPRICSFHRLFCPQTSELLDEVLITFFQSPNSFTGEDVIEINLHNSPYILSKVSQILLQEAKFEFAKPGEFSKRAVLNGKIDLVQAEAIPDLINSETSAAHRQAINQMQGNLSQIYEKWRIAIIELLAMMTAAIDFPDEDLPKEIWQELQQQVKSLADEIAEHLDDKRLGAKIRDGFSLAILGAPNVGKSSLLNFLANREAAIVSKHPGTTRDIIELHIEIGGYQLVIADTAGIRNSSNPIEQEGIKRALQKAQIADLKILMIDGANLKDGFNQLAIDPETILVINKIDQIVQINDDKAIQPLLLNQEESKKFLDELFADQTPEIRKKISELKTPPILISVLNQKNLGKLIEVIHSKLQALLPAKNQNFITHERYRSGLLICLNSLNEFTEFAFEKSIELLAEDLRIAAHELGKITGKIDLENILDVVFSRFCIGK